MGTPNSADSAAASVSASQRNKLGLGLGGQVHEHAALGLLGHGLDHAVQAVGGVQRHGRGIAGVVMQQCAVRTVGVKADEGLLAVNEVLGEHAGQQRFAYAAFLAADEMDLAHADVS